MKEFLQALDRMQIACPLRITARAREKNSCCGWETFREGFVEAWPRWFDLPPSSAQWTAARRDWRAGNTGWEAAHNAQRRVKEKVQRAEHDAWDDAQVILNRAGRA